ncbi:FadR/GntR family transcriptional regulator [Pontibacillus litoralis]|uniref:GntR family transcriptional regulator n=1 Tax=Pontibacillus litoralis JSM 072002 TaxID=1385512 RepID=A0A0A5FXP6_9BACI|nr:FadR/GntR family transcriptional regulator [Pontibacillus litoralis]KGX85591.1 GntR family transcriptional regulator [Pontibacillus litoralis JSM 072002]
MEYKQIQAKKIYEEVADSLLAMLKNGSLQPGDKLESVERLAKNFNVGRSAIREALSALRAMGVLEMRQGEGTFVKQFDASRFSVPLSVAFLMKRENVKELLEVRKILEIGVVESAVNNHTKEDLLSMKQALYEMERAGGNGDLGEKADLEFHLAIAKASHNHMLYNLMQSVSEIMKEAMRETRRLWLFSEQNMLTLLEEHWTIYYAIEQCDDQLAQKLMLNHLTGVESALADYVQ